MALLLHVVFEARSESVAVRMLELLSRMSELVHRDHPGVYTYLFRQAIDDNEGKTKLLFTELYSNEQVFLEHARDAEFGRLYLQAFNGRTGKSEKELCIRDDITQPLLPGTASALNNYLHVTHINVQQGCLHQAVNAINSECVLVVCSGCDENVYEQFNALAVCVTCVTFEPSNTDRQMIAVVARFRTETSAERQPSIDKMELVVGRETMTDNIKEFMNKYFQIRSLNVQTNFVGYICH